jgi:hypothetical protein
MEMPNENDLHLLVSTIAHPDRAGKPLGKSLRDQLICWLEVCLVDHDRFNMYFQAVEQVMGGNGEKSRLSEARLNLIVDKGLSVLTDEELRRLALNADTLCSLHHDEIELNEYWVGRFAQVGAAEVDALPKDERQALLARRKAFEQRFMELLKNNCS